MKGLSRRLNVAGARLVSFRSSEVSSKLPNGWDSIGKRRISKSDTFDNNSAKCGPIFGRPFVKRFALCYRSVVCPVCLSCLSVLSVTFVHCGQMVGRIKMKLGMLVGLGPWPHCVRWEPSSPSREGAHPQLSAHICCGQMAAWI